MTPPRSIIKWNAAVALALLALCVTTFALHAPRLGLLHDDWFYYHEVAAVAGSPAATPQLVNPFRPLHQLPWRLCGVLFGDNLAGYYLVLFALQWLAAVLLYLLASRHAGHAFAAAFAALAMVYPADASHLWLSSMPLRAAWLLALAAILLAQRSRDSGAAGGMLAATGLGFVSLAFYELHFFVLALWPAVAWLLRAPWRRGQIALWSVIPAVYLLWRFAAAGEPSCIPQWLGCGAGSRRPRALDRVPRANCGAPREDGSPQFPRALDARA